MKTKFAKRICAVLLLLFTLLLVCSCGGSVSSAGLSRVYADGKPAFFTVFEADSIIDYVRHAEEAVLPEREEPDFDVMLIMESGIEMLIEGYGDVIDAKTYSSAHLLTSERIVESKGLREICEKLVEFSGRAPIDPEKIVRFEKYRRVEDDDFTETSDSAPEWIGELIACYDTASSGDFNQNRGPDEVRWTFTMEDGSRFIFSDGEWNTIVKTYGPDGKLIRTQVLYSDDLYDLLYEKSGIVSIPKPEGLGY